MIKKCLFLLFALILYVNHAFSAPQSNFLSTENNLWFTTDVVKNAIVEHIPADKQQPVATLYQELMDTNTGRISVSSLFKVCEKAGFNTKRSEGYEKCKQFIEQMLTDAEVATEVNLGGFCPGPDKNGNNPNSLFTMRTSNSLGRTSVRITSRCSLPNKGRIECVDVFSTYPTVLIQSNSICPI